jgi:hypothetical protein
MFLLRIVFCLLLIIKVGASLITGEKPAQAVAGVSARLKLSLRKRVVEAGFKHGYPTGHRL